MRSLVELFSKPRAQAPTTRHTPSGCCPHRIWRTIGDWFPITSKRRRPTRVFPLSSDTTCTLHESEMKTDCTKKYTRGARANFRKYWRVMRNQVQTWEELETYSTVVEYIQFRQTRKFKHLASNVHEPFLTYFDQLCWAAVTDRVKQGSINCRELKLHTDYSKILVNTSRYLKRN